MSKPEAANEGMSATQKRNYALLLAAGMLVTGTMNTLFTKFQSLQSFECADPANPYDCDKCPEDAPDGTCVPFEQPVLQTFTMFLGEFICFIVYYILRYFNKRKAAQAGTVYDDGNMLVGLRSLLMWIPALCDMTATTLMNLGLILTHASVYQMLRGCVVVFTGIMSVIFLKRKQYLFHWVGMFLVIAGVTIVGLASTLMTGGDDAPAAKNPVLGDILIISAQIFTATQFVVEEKILGKYDAPPMLAIGLEGLFGGLSTAFLMPIFHFAIGVNDFASMFDMKFAFMRLFDSPAILISTIGSVISISFFNFFGLSVTKFMSATSRSTIDAMRTLFVWMFSLIFGWEAFVWVQIIGFIILVTGTFFYNEVFRIRRFFYYPDNDTYQALPKEDEDAPDVEAGGAVHAGSNPDTYNETTPLVLNVNNSDHMD